MAAKKSSSGKYRKVDPDEFYNYEEQFLDNGSGSRSGKAGGGKGKKTLKDLKRQQRAASLNQRWEELEAALHRVLDNFPAFERNEIEPQHLEKYVAWVEENLNNLSPLDPSQLEIYFSKSGGPGGQNVNKRETKVSILHKPTHIRVISDQTRSQRENRKLALEQLENRLNDHLRDWRMYLGENKAFDISLVKAFLDNLKNEF